MRELHRSVGIRMEIWNATAIIFLCEMVVVGISQRFMIFSKMDDFPLRPKISLALDG